MSKEISSTLKAPSPIIIRRSEPIPILPKIPHTPIISKSAPGSCHGFFVGSPRSGEILDLYKSSSGFLKLPLKIGGINLVDENIDQSLLLVGEKSEEEE